MFRSTLASRRRRKPSKPSLAWKRQLQFEPLEERRVLAPIADVGLSLQPQAMLGSDVNFTVTFDNTAANVASNTGFGPYVDVIFPKTGADGDDGLSFTSVSAGSLAVTPQRVTFDATGHAVHPFAKTATGAPLVIAHPDGAAGAGDELVVVALPFGSFTPAQTPTSLSFKAKLSDLADLDQPLTVIATGGYQFGADALDNPTTDAPIRGTTQTASITPTVFSFGKTYNGISDDDGATIELSTGPNHPASFTLAVDLATGQQVSGLEISDILPQNHSFLAVTSVLINGVSATPGVDYVVASSPTVMTAPPYRASSPNRTLDLAFHNSLGVPTLITGSGAGTVLVTVSFYIPEFQGNGTTVVISPTTGNKVVEANVATVLGTVDPKDPRDSLVPTSATSGPTTIQEESLTLQKSSSVVYDAAPAGMSPGDIVEWTLHFDVSDFFAFNNLRISDIVDDGVEFDPTNADPNLGVSPKLTVTRGGVTSGPLSFSLAGSGAPFTGSDNYFYSVDTDGLLGDFPNLASDPLHTGQTQFDFDVSKLLRDSSLDGKFVGGLFANRNVNAGSTEGTLTFRTRVLDKFRETFQSGHANLDERDTIHNVATVTADVLAPGYTATGFTESDSDSASIQMMAGTWTKTLYAINGSTTLPTPLHLNAGDELTYRLQYNLAFGDFEQLSISDFLPLPIFRVNDADATSPFGSPVYSDGPSWTLQDNFSLAPTTTPPVSGSWKRGPADTHTKFADANSDETMGDVAVTTDYDSNELKFSFGVYDDPANTPGVIDLLFTVTATGDPFADGLFLTNEATVSTSNTFQQQVSAPSNVQIEMGSPDLHITKGIVATDNVNAVYSLTDVGPVSFSAPGSAGYRGVGTITSDGLSATPIDSNVSSVDAGDLVTFAIVVENTGDGRRGAYDVRIRDLLPTGYVMPTGGFNISVTDGTGATYSYSAVNPLDPFPLFGDGIEIADPGPTSPTSDGTNGGALDSYDPTDGRNILIITYDAQLDGIPPSSSLLNTATLFNYAATEGGRDFTADYITDSSNYYGQDLTDDAQADVPAPELTKSIVTTSEPSTSATDVAIGEIVRYRLVTMMPESSTTNLDLTDLLPTGMQFLNDGTAKIAFVADSSAPGSITSSLIDTGVGLVVDGNESNVASIHPTFVFPGAAIGMSGNDPVFHLGDFAIDENDANQEFVVIEFNALVLNDGTTNDGGTLSNTFQITSDDLAAIVSDPVDVTVREPNMSLAKSITGAPPKDAGDLVTYSITISNTGSATAFDLRLTDDAATNLVFDVGSVTIDTVSGGATAVSITSGNTPGDTQIGLSIDSFPVGASVIITYTGHVQIGVRPSEVVTNTADLTYTSLPGGGTVSNPTGSSIPGASGADDGERNGSGAPANNDYFANDTASFTVNPLQVVKSVVATSETHTTGTNLAIGEIVRYRLQTRIVEGTLANLTISDTLPTGLTFVNDGTARVALVSDGASSTITSTVLAGAGLEIVGDTTTIGSVVPTFVIPSGQITAGATTIFALGDVVNHESDADDEYVVIEFNALVTNGANTNNGEVKTNSYSAKVAADPVVVSNSVNVTLVEPLLGIDLTLQGSPPLDATDVASYQAVVTNTGTATAFNVRLTDLLPSQLNLNVGTVVVTLGGGASGSTVLLGNTSGDTSIDVGIDSVPVGSTVTVTFTATTNTTLAPNQQITNTANVTYTSLPGTGTASNATGSVTPGATGATDGERSGSGTPAYNDYFSSDPASFTSEPVIPVKSIAATSEASTSGSNLAIGEIVRYRLATRLPEGTSTNFRLSDTLPSGFSYLNDNTTKVAFVSDGASGTITSSIVGLSGAGLEISGDETTAYASLAPTFVLPAGQISSGATVVFTLGDLVNTEIDADQEYVVVEFNALVTNVAGNAAPQTRNNSFSVLVGASPAVTSNTVTATLVEPSITNLTKTIVGAAPTDAQDFVTYRLTFGNAGTTTAFDVRALDDISSLPLSINPSSVTLVRSDSVATGWMNNTTSTSLDVLIDSLPVGVSATLQFTAQVLVSAHPSQTISNTAGITYTSLPGALGTTSNPTGSATPGTSGASNGERNGAGTSPNLYLDSDSTQFTLAPPTASKTLVATSESHTSGSNVAIGEIVRYRLQTSLSEGTTNNLKFVDTLPAGMSLVDPTQVMLSFVATNDVLEDATLAGADNDALPPSFVLPAARISTVGQTVTFDFGTLVNQDDDADVELVTLEFNALVLNVGGNVNNTTLNNQFVVNIAGVNQATSNVSAVTVKTPSVSNFTKTIVGASPTDAGDRVHYRVTYTNSGGTDGFDNRIFDDLAGKPLLLDTASVVVTLGGGATGVTDSSDSDTLDLLIGDVPAGGTVTIDYEATVTSSVTPLQSVTNTASLAYTTLPGANGTTTNATGSSTPGGSGTSTGERDGSGGALNTLHASSSRSFTAGSPTVAKSISATSISNTGSAQFNAGRPDVAIGETVTYLVTASLIEGTNAVTITDNVPAGMSVVSATVVSLGANLSGSSLAIGASATLSDVNVVDGLNDRAVFSFGTITNTSDNVADANDQIVVQVVGRVENVGGNVSGTVLTNTATLNYGSGSANSSQSVDVVVPQLQIVKSVQPIDADTTRYRLVVTHAAASQAPAFDVTLADLLSNPSLQLVAGSVVIDAATTVVGATVASGNGVSDTNVSVTAPVVELGQTLIITFDANIPSVQSARIDNTGRVDWDSNPDAGPARTGNATSTASVGAIGDFVYYDTNGNGSPNAGEPGIPGLTVQLTWAGADGNLATAGDNVVETTTTDSSGGYQFRGLPDGVYRVVVTPPAGASNTGDPDGGLDSRSQLTLVTSVSAVNSLQDFGYRGTAAVGDNVFSDIDLDGVRDVGEIGISGLTVTLSFDADGNGSKETTFTTTTDSNGDYHFNFLLAGSYSVAVSAPVGSFPTSDLDGDTVKDTSHAFTLATGENRVTEDFGLAMPADLSLTKSVVSSTPNFGDTVTFTIVVSNAGPFTATGVSVTDVVPVGFNSIGSISSGGTRVGNTITWSGLTLASGGSATFTFTAVVAAGQTFPVDYTNVAQVASSQQYDPDSVPNNNVSTEDDQATAIALVPAIHLESYINGQDADTAGTAASAPASSTGSLTYVVTNPGGVALTNVTVVDDNGTPANSADNITPTYVSGDVNGNTRLDPGETWTFSATRPLRFGLTAANAVASGRSQPNPSTIVTDDDPIYVQGVINAGVLATDKLCANKARVVDLDTGTTLRQITPFEASFNGGVSVTYGDLTGDGIDEIIFAAGAGRAAEIRVFSQAGTELTQYRTLAWPTTYKSGIEVAVGDYDGDGDNDLIVVPKTGAVQVKVFANSPGAADPIADNPVLTITPAFPSGFKGGAEVVVGNLVDNRSAPGAPDPVEIVVGNGSGIRATVLVYSRTAPSTWSLVDTLYPFTSAYTGGVNLSLGRINSDGIADIIVSPISGNNSTIEVWDGNTTDLTDVRLASFTTFYDLASRNAGVTTYPMDSNGDGIAEKIVVVQGANGTAVGPRVFNSNGIGTFTQLTVPLAPWNVSGLKSLDPALISQFYTPPANAYGGSGEAMDTPNVVEVTINRDIPAPYSATNGDSPGDVDGDGVVAPADALRAINLLNELGAGFRWSQSVIVKNDGTSYRAAAVSDGGQGWADVDADGYLTPRDILRVIEELNLIRASQTDPAAAADAVFSEESFLAP